MKEKICNICNGYNGKHNVSKCEGTFEPVKTSLRSAEIVALAEAIRYLQDIHKELKETNKSIKSFLEIGMQYQEESRKPIPPIVFPKGKVAGMLGDADAEEKERVQKSIEESEV